MAKKSTDASVHQSNNPDDDLNELRFAQLSLIYGKCCENWRHYDSHVWQIPSLAVAINAFLIGQAFNPDLAVFGHIIPIPFFQVDLHSEQVFRGLIIILAGFLTCVLLIALVKHRLHQRAQDRNIELLEKKLPYRTIKYDFSKKEVLEDVEPGADRLVKILAKTKASQWLMGVMLLTVIVDALILAGIFFYWW